MSEPLSNKAALDAVRELHQRQEVAFHWRDRARMPYCKDCLQEWPCRTIQAIGGEK